MPTHSPVILRTISLKYEANWGPQRRGTLLAEEIHKEGLPKKSHQRVFREEAQKRGFACRSMFKKRVPAKIALASFAGRGRESAFLAKPRWGFDRFRAWEWHMERAISGLPRRCEADAWEEEQRGFYRARMRASEHSREERSGLRNLLRCDEAQGKPSSRDFIYISRKSFC